MIDFQLLKPKTNADAIAWAAKSPTAQHGALVRLVAGGTTLVDLMRLNVEQPAKVIDINRLGMDRIEKRSDGTLRIGALVRNADLAHHSEVIAYYAALSQALLSGASAQLRNMATTGGNLLQRTRCPYFRDLSFTECNKRNPGSGCAAITGHNRTNAILGGSEHCIATHPSDMAVAMMAFQAVIHVQGVKGARDIAIGDFYKLPGKTPNIENALAPGDLITSVTLPAPITGARSTYLKLRDRASYEFALSSAAVVMQITGGHISHVRIALGGVGTRPWRSLEAEDTLQGRAVSAANFRVASEAALREAKPQSENGFKVELAKRCIVRALVNAAASA
jgi:xanthine dehydrogenase YagS FAD-binding subunit